MFDVKELYATHIAVIDAATDSATTLYSGLANMMCLAVAGEHLHHGEGVARYPVRKKVIDKWMKSDMYAQIRDMIHRLIPVFRTHQVGIEDLDYISLSSVGLDGILVHFEGRKVSPTGDIYNIHSGIKIIHMTAYYDELFQSAIFSPLVDALPQMVRHCAAERGIDIRMDIIL